MSGVDIWLALGLVVVLLLTAVLSASETVLTRLDIVRALRLEGEGRKHADTLTRVVEHRARGLSVTLLLTIIMRVAAATLVLAVVRERNLSLTIEIAALGLLVLLSYVLVEVAPRTLTLRHLENVGLALAPVLKPVVTVMHPLATGLATAGRLLVGGRDVSGPYATVDDDANADVEETDDVMDASEREMISSIFELGETVVREIMVPRPDMVAVDETATFRDVLDTFVLQGYSRVPVFHETLDEISGVLYAKDALERLSEDPSYDDWPRLARPVSFIPETKRVDDLLRDLQAQMVHMAIVVDEYGQVVGLVTIEDILEEIVGEIVDEHDHEEPMVVELDGRWRVDARLPVDDLNALLGANLPDDAWDSVGGLLYGTLGRVPRPGEQAAIDGIIITAERIQGRRISKVLVARSPQTSGDDSQQDNA